MLIAEQENKFLDFFFIFYKMDKCVWVCVQPFQPLKQLIEFYGIRKSDMPPETQQIHTTEVTKINN